MCRYVQVHYSMLSIENSVHQRAAQKYMGTLQSVGQNCLKYILNAILFQTEQNFIFIIDVYYSLSTIENSACNAYSYFTNVCKKQFDYSLSNNHYQLILLTQNLSSVMCIHKHLCRVHQSLYSTLLEIFHQIIVFILFIFFN